MRKLKLELHDLRIDSFTTTPMAREKGTVLGEQCTCDTACSCPGCPTCDVSCTDPCGSCTCWASCNGSCVATCGASCYGTCDLSCDEGNTCAATCGPMATAPNSPCAEC
jgi:hypothetical protein